MMRSPVPTWTTPKSPPRAPGSYRRKSSGARRRSDASNDERALAAAKTDSTQFKVCFAMRGHLDVVRSVIFTGGGSPAEPEFCTASDDGCASSGGLFPPRTATSLNKTMQTTSIKPATLRIVDIAVPSHLSLHVQAIKTLQPVEEPMAMAGFSPVAKMLASRYGSAVMLMQKQR